MEPLSAEVEELVRRAAVTLAPEHLRRIAKALCGETAWTPLSLHRAQQVVQAPASRRFTAELCEAWNATCSKVPGAALAGVLRVAASVTEDMLARTGVDIVWTGPATQAVPVRLTSAVLRDVIAESRSSLHILSFATHRLQDVFHALQDAAARGVAITMVLESAEESGGKLTYDDIARYRRVTGLGLYIWPKDQRPAVGSGLASMHAKAAVADSSVALVSSANLTGAGLESNMELGLLVRGGDLPRRLVRHLQELIVRGSLAPLP